MQLASRSEFVLRRVATLLSVSILTLSLVAGATGALIAFYYQPTAGGAYTSLQTITQAIPMGSIVRSLHNFSGNGLIILGLIQLVVMFLGRQLKAPWIAGWLSNILLVLVAIGLGWTAMLLSWDQVGYWRLQIELGTIEAIPVIGPSLRNILSGGGGVTTLTVAHLYALHSYVLAIVAPLLAVIHLGSLILQELRSGKPLAFPQLQRKLQELLGGTDPSPDPQSKV